MVRESSYAGPSELTEVGTEEGVANHIPLQT